MPQYYRILDNGMPKPKSKKKSGSGIWGDADAARGMMARYAGDSSDLKNVRNAMSKKGVNNVFEQLHYMAESDYATAGNRKHYKSKTKKNVKKGAK